MCENSQSKSLNRLMEYLIINNVNVINNGLYHGKMGVIICLCEYARYVNDDIYLELAGDLLDEIFGEMNFDIPVNYENGVCGLGWGVEYLIRQKYMSGNTDEILEEVDNRVMQIDINRVKDFSIKTGLGGIALYIVTRMTAMDRTKWNEVPFDLSYLENWMRMLPVWLLEEKCPNTVLKIFAKLRGLLQDLPYVHKEHLSFPSYIPLGDFTKVEGKSLRFMAKGIEDGIAGMALQLMKV